MMIKNALVFRVDAGFAEDDIAIHEDCFADSAEGEVIDAAGCYAIPGLIDVHLHGCMRRDFSGSPAADINKMTEYQAANGVTALCPTTMTLPEEVLAEACRQIALADSDTGAAVVGINLEGPFVSPNKLGAQNPDFVGLPSAELFRRLQQAAGGIVKLLAVAPEIEGAQTMIAELRHEVVLSIAHTTADYDTAMAAFANGARQVTHLYNAMPPFTHRDPGVIGAAFDTPECRVELITDNVHIHPSVVRATFRMFGDDRILLVSDSMMATGLEDGEYELGGQPVVVKGNTARLKEHGNIAGSVTNLMNCLRTAVQRMGIPLHSAVKCASVNPARSIGVYDSRGSIEPGKIADLVLLDEELRIRQVILRGRPLPQ